MDEPQKKKNEIDETKDTLEQVDGGTWNLGGERCRYCGGKLKFVKTTFGHYYECADCGKRL